MMSDIQIVQKGTGKTWAVRVNALTSLPRVGEVIVLSEDYAPKVHSIKHTLIDKSNGAYLEPRIYVI